MIITVSKPTDMEVSSLKLNAGVRYWEDGTVNGQEDHEGDLIPMRCGDYWVIVIDLTSGHIANWPKGTTADVHYKTCDDNSFELLAANGDVLAKTDGYVPGFFPGDHYGDYVIMKIDGEGRIEDWYPPTTRQLEKLFFHKDD